jgi:hypothetical protein
MPGEFGPAKEEGIWVGPRENSTLLDLFKYFKKTSIYLIQMCPLQILKISNKI